MDSHPFMSIHPLISMIELFLNLTFKIQGQSHSSRSHNRYNILSPHIPFIPCWSALPFLRCSYLKKMTLKIQGQGHGWGQKVQSHNVSVTSYRLTHFRSMSIWHPIAELRLFQNLTLKFKDQGHRWGHSSKSQCGYNILLTHIPFVSCQSALPFLRYSIFKIWPWKLRVKVKWPWCCTTTGLDNSIELRMV